MPNGSLREGDNTYESKRQSGREGGRGARWGHLKYKLVVSAPLDRNMYSGIEVAQEIEGGDAQSSTTLGRREESISERRGSVEARPGQVGVNEGVEEGWRENLEEVVAVKASARETSDRDDGFGSDDDREEEKRGEDEGGREEIVDACSEDEDTRAEWTARREAADNLSRARLWDGSGGGKSEVESRRGDRGKGIEGGLVEEELAVERECQQAEEGWRRDGVVWHTRQAGRYLSTRHGARKGSVRMERECKITAHVVIEYEGDGTGVGGKSECDSRHWMYRGRLGERTVVTAEAMLLLVVLLLLLRGVEAAGAVVGDRICRGRQQLLAGLKAGEDSSTHSPTLLTNESNQHHWQ
ncbi:hypothetical protein R3P38DRAFT_3365377 [Favolaschia claudopus]|uniref:Uncharacterized protein n=1 Tax=Favolaschia claudopus TaxID=2862362 RepID=A0AAW0AFV8_9AGAR